MECFDLEIGGVEDHVHILCSLSKKKTLIELLEELKKSSSKWIKAQGPQYEQFYWQRGYAAFSVFPDDVLIVQKYIRNQEAHHARTSFKEEYLAFMVKYEMPMDEKYMWD